MGPIQSNINNLLGNIEANLRILGLGSRMEKGFQETGERVTAGTKGIQEDIKNLNIQDVRAGQQREAYEKFNELSPEEQQKQLQEDREKTLREQTSGYNFEDPSLRIPKANIQADLKTISRSKQADTWANYMDIKHKLGAQERRNFEGMMPEEQETVRKLYKGGNR